MLAAIGQLPGQPQFARGGLAVDFAFLPSAQSFFGALDNAGEQGAGGVRGAGKPMVEMVFQRRFDQPCRFGVGQLLLGLSLEFRIRDEDREQRAGPAHHVVRRDRAGAAIVGHLAVGLQALGHRRAKAGLVRAALRRRHCVAVGVQERFAIFRPGDGPFDPPAVVGQRDASGERRRRDAAAFLKAGVQEVLQPAGEVQDRFRRRVVLQLLGVALPADFDTAKQIGLGPRHAVQPGRVECRALAEDLRVRREADQGAAAVRRRTHFL